MTVTHKELRRALIWAQKRIDSLYQEDPFKYYGFMKGHSCVPIALYRPDIKKAIPVGWAHRGAFTECVTFPSWRPFARLDTDYTDGETWKGYFDIIFGGKGFDTADPYYSWHLYLYCTYQPDPENPKRMKLTIKIDDISYWTYAQPLPIDMAPEPLPPCYLEFRTPTYWEILSDDLARDLGKTFTIYTEEFGIFPSIRYNNRITNYVGAMHYWFSSSHPEWKDRALRLFNYLDEWGFYYHYYAPLYRYSDDWPDDFFWHPNVALDCDTWSAEWVATYRYPYWSKICICRSLYLWYSLVAPKWPMWKAMRAMHLINKYKSLDAPEQSGLINRRTGKGMTAREWIFNGGDIDVGGGQVITVTPLLDNYKSGFGVFAPDFPDAVMPICTAGLLAVASEAGYGFGVDELKPIADDCAEILIKSQWGYPFNPGEEGKARTKDYGIINRPDQTGGWAQYFEYDEHGNVVQTWQVGWLEQTITTLAGMPEDIAIDSWIGLEPTAHIVRALQIYEWYKFKGGTGVFPRLLIPEDINGDGVVDITDVSIMAAKWGAEEGDANYDSLCDLNNDGVIDVSDLSAIGLHWGRTSDLPPRKVTIPALVQKEAVDASLLAASFASAMTAVMISVMGAKRMISY